jgi:diguanylate cyclase (GGDEF)-like protein
VKTTAELLRFLISRLNKTKSKYNENEVSRISHLLIESFVPSIAPKDHKDLQKINNKLTNNPSLIEQEQIKNEIKSAIALRIALDKKSVKDMVKSLDGVMDKISLRLIKMIEVSDSSNDDIQSIKKELENYHKEGDSDFKEAHNKLYNIVVSLEESTRALSADLKVHSSELQQMNLKIKNLERELEAAKKDSKEDFLTKLYNKRALDEFFEVKEAEFQRHNHNYSIVMFDLDHFKLVNDNYGHETGDIVLKSFAQILKREVRTEDIVGRFGGEEFVAILSETDSQGAVVFAEKVRQNVEKAHFMHKKDRIKVTVSCGVTERAKYPSLQEVFVGADDNLYKAKDGGRNRVVS